MNYLYICEQACGNMRDCIPFLLSRNVRAYPNKWIRKGPDAPVNWPVCPPDLNPCDFFLWSAIKSRVYATKIATETELWRRIQEAADTIRNNAINLQRMHFNFSRRINICLAENGRLTWH